MDGALDVKLPPQPELLVVLMARLFQTIAFRAPTRTMRSFSRVVASLVSKCWWLWWFFLCCSLGNAGPYRGSTANAAKPFLAQQKQRQAPATTTSTTTTTTTTTTPDLPPARERVSFDFGWKHRAGLHRWPFDPYEPPPAPTHNDTSRGYTYSYIDPGPSPMEANPHFVPCDWIDARLPHDGILSNPFGNAPSTKACPNGCSGRSYVPRHVLWYRKEFALPEGGTDAVPSWEEQVLGGTSSVSLAFGGSFRNTTVYVNGKRVLNHECGYTPFRVELTRELLEKGRRDSGSNSGGGRAGDGRSVHTIAVFVDPDNGEGGGTPERGSGWWYEGGGLYRGVVLEKVPVPPRIASVVAVTRAIEAGNPHPNATATATTATGGAEMARALLRREGHHSQSHPPTTATLELRADFEAARATGRDETEDYCFGFAISGKDDGDAEGGGPGGGIVVETPLRPVSLATPDRGSSTAAATVTVTETVKLREPFLELWTASNPHLYEITARLYRGCNGERRPRPYHHHHHQQQQDARLVDSAAIVHGVRTLRFDADTGVYRNGRPYKVRGFCDHDAFAVVGMAVPDRIHLFRAQASRSIGGNSRRASHNPPDPTALDVYDRLGMLVIDENRLFANNSRWVQNMADLVVRDRNHPSVAAWSFCNELGCEGDHELGGPAFQEVTKALDGSRPTLANMFTFHDLLSDTIDIQGFSHSSRETLDHCHSELPEKPIVMSECCSCNTMRDEDEGCETMSDNPHTTCNQKAFNARCLEKLVNASDGTEYSSGTFVWTLFDYYGEPPSKPLTVSSTYGQFDLCGFPKASAFWFRSQWLLSPPLSNDTALGADNTLTKAAAIENGKPFLTDKTEVHIVESWESPDHWNETRGNKTRTIHAYSNAPVVELFANGVSQGKQSLVPMVEGDAGTYGEWFDVPWSEGILTAFAQSEDGTELARSTKETTNKGTPPSNSDCSLDLSLDCPSKLTGTGDSLFLDGQDAALVRATIVLNSSGRPVHFASHNVTFRIVSGPGRVQGTANGDPKSYRSHTSSSHDAYHGLVRAVVRVTSVAGLSAREKHMLKSMEVFQNEQEGCAPPSPSATATDSAGLLSFDDERDIVIEATSPGFAPVQLTIPTSVSRGEASVLSVAAREAGRPVDFFSSSRQ